MAGTAHNSSDAMKLLIHSNFFAPSVGGVETFVLSLARGLAAFRAPGGELEFEITVVTKTAASTFDDESLPFRIVRQPSAIQLWDLVRACDVVHVAGAALPPIVQGWLARKPVIVEHHGFQVICPNGQLLIEPSGTPCPGHFMAGRHAECLRCNSGEGVLPLFKLWSLTFARRWLCRRVAKNITPTAWLGGLIHLPRIAAIPHGLEFVATAPVNSAAASQVPVVAFQGRLVSTKGVGVLFEAARILLKQNREFKLLVIGDGPERSSLQLLAQQSPLAGRVRFTGRLAGAELESALLEAAVVVVPSLGGEVFGLVVAENMSRELPVIASDLGAFVEVLGEGGLTFRTGDAAGLATELGRILDDPAFAARLGQLGRKRAVEFCDFRRMLEAHARIYREVHS